MIIRINYFKREKEKNIGYRGMIGVLRVKNENHYSHTLNFTAMKTHPFFYLLLLVVIATTTSTQLFAQTDSETFHTISGTVRDAGNKRPVAFASVFIPGTHTGTVANLNGSFTLKVKKNLDITEFAISHLGYRVSKFSISDHQGKSGEFFLNPHSIMLQEVLVRPLDPRELVEGALNRVKENYPEEPYRLTGFYREAIKKRRDYISISEAIIDVYQSSYTSRISSDRVKIIRGRKSGDVKDVDTLILKLQGGPTVAMLLDIMKNPGILISREMIDFYNYEFLDIVKIDEKNHYVVGFEPAVILPFPLFFGKFYISADDLAIAVVEFSMDLSDKKKATRNFIQRKPFNLRFSANNTSYMVSYKKIDGKYHLNYLRGELEFFADWRRRIFRTRYNVMFEMAITERTTENVERFSARESFSRRNILSDMVPVYFEDGFWGEYNYIEPEESIESAIEKLNRRIEGSK